LGTPYKLGRNGFEFIPRLSGSGWVSGKQQLAEQKAVGHKLGKNVSNGDDRTKRRYWGRNN
jgi:hypothetical protein